MRNSFQKELHGISIGSFLLEGPDGASWWERDLLSWTGGSKSFCELASHAVVPARLEPSSSYLRILSALRML